LQATTRWRSLFTGALPPISTGGRGRSSEVPPPDEEPVDHRAAGDPVAHAIQDERAAVPFLEPVLVDPRAIGAASLLVHEAIRRLPRGDLGLPPHRPAAQAKPVVDQEPGAPSGVPGCARYR